MPKIINLDVRRKVIEGCIASGDISAIAKEFEISEATVRSILRQAAAGKIPEYTSRATQIDDLVALSQALKASGKTLDQTATGLAAFQGLTQAGVDPLTLKPAIQILTRIAEPGFPTEKFVQAALKLNELKEKHGLGYDEVVAKHEGLVNEIADKSAEVSKLNQAILSLQQKLDESKSALDRELEKNNATLTLLERYVQTRKAFEGADLSLETDVGSAIDFIKNAKTTGFLEASKEVAKLRLQTGKTYEELVKEYQQNLQRHQEAQQTALKISERVLQITTNVAELTKQESNLLTQYNLTKQKLEYYLNLVERLKAYGIDFDNLESLTHVLEEVKKYGS